MRPQRNNKLNISPWLLRAGLAFVFLYAAISSLQNPDQWVGYLPQFLTKAFNAHTLLKIFSIYELALTVWLLSGWYLRWAALICAATLAGIVLSGPNQLIITFRDVGLAFMALALFFAPE